MVRDNQDQEAGLLLQFMFAELEAARSLYMDNLLEQAAFHLLRGWRALARLQTPEGAAAQQTREALDLAALLGKEPAGWSESLASLRALVGEDDDQLRPLTAALDRKTQRRLRKHIELQLHLCDQAYQRAFRQQRSATSRWLQVGRRLPRGSLVVVGVLIALAVGIYLARAPEIRPPKKGKGGQAAAGHGTTVQDDAAEDPPPPKNTKNREVTLAQVKKVKKAGSMWHAEGNVVFLDWVKVKLPGVMTAASVELSVDNNDVYELSFHKGEQEVGLERLEPNKALSGLRVLTVKIPEGAQEDGFDMIQLKAVIGDSFYSLGHLLLKGKGQRAGDAGPVSADAASKK